MGRRKISIQPITEERNRKVTFVKRKAGLFKKAHELAVLCQVDLAVIILGNNGAKFYEYSSVGMDELIELHRDPKILHDSKIPGDYGDYELRSRVNKNNFNRTHTRNVSSLSLSIDENESNDEDEDNDENEEDEEEEEETVPPSKKRKTTKKSNDSRGKPLKLASKETIDPQPQFQQPPSQKQPQQKLQQKPQQQQIQQPQQQIQLVQNVQPHPPFLPQNVQQIPQVIYGSSQAIPQQYQQMRSTLQQGRVLHPHVPLDGNTDAASHPPTGSFPNHLPDSINQYQFPSFQFTPGTPVSNHSQDIQSVGTPIVTTAKDTQSPFSTSRARSLNNSVNSRPVLSLKIPGDNQQNKAGDNAMNATTIETSQNDIKSSKREEKIPMDAQREGNPAKDNKSQALDASSNKSTPISATLPSGLFSLPLPLPQPSQHQYSNQPAFKLMAGEQTPLTGGLPSKYVPDLFPSPSNFYSNEWNIPFGSGSTPYPNSAAGGGHQLPNISGVSNNSASSNGRLKKQYSHLNNDPIESPLQNVSKGDNSSRKGNRELTSKKIKFEEGEKEGKRRKEGKGEKS